MTSQCAAEVKICLVSDSSLFCVIEDQLMGWMIGDAPRISAKAVVVVKPRLLEFSCRFQNLT